MPKKRYDDEILMRHFDKKTIERIRKEVEEEERHFLKTPFIFEEEFKEFSEEVIRDWRELIGRCG